MRTDRKTFRRKALLLVLALTLVLGIMPFEAGASAALPDLNDKSVYYTPDYKSGECILSSCKCMFRRAAIMRGSHEWDTITNTALRGIATNKSGLFRHSFDYTNDGITYTVSIMDLKGTEAAKINTVANMLLNHPEGIIVWGSNANSAGPHAVLVTGCTRGVLYAADSVYNTHGRNYGIRAWNDTSMKSISKCTDIWYISKINGVSQKTPQSGSAATQAGYVKPDPLVHIINVRAPQSIKKGRSFSIKGKIYSLRKMKRVRVQILRASGKTAISETTKPNRAYYNLKKLDRRVKFRKLKRGTYTYKVKAQTSRGWETLVEQGFTIY